MRLDLTELMERYRDRLYAAAFAVCRDPQDAEDVVQETFLAYYRENREFESEEHIRAWLLRVAVNKARNAAALFWRRNRVSLEEYMETLDFPEPEDKSLMEAVLALPERFRIPLHLHYFEDYSVEEIAALLGVPPGTVKSRLFRARRQLRDKLQEGWDDDE